MTKSKPSTRVALGALLLPTSLAFAQPVSMPTQVPDVLSFEVSGGVEHHSNIFRVPDGPSDTVLRGLLGLRFEREVSLQRFSAYANVQPVKYLDFSQFDYVGYGVGGTWDWEIGRPVFGTVSASYLRDQSAFDTIGAVNNLRNMLSLRALAGFRMTQSWSAIGAIDYLTFDNSVTSQQASDFDRTGYELGLRYAPETSLSFDMLFRREDGDYPNRQVFDANGNLLPATIDNAYAQDAVLLRIGYQPSDLTRLVGTIGYTKRSFDNVPQRDFSGLTGSIDWERPLSGAFLSRVSLFRLIDSAELLNANYLIATGIALRPTWTLTGRTTLDGALVYSVRDYAGDPGFVFSGSTVRKDKLLEIGLRANYEVARRVFVYGELRRMQRNSNYGEFDFDDNWFGAGVRALF